MCYAGMTNNISRTHFNRLWKQATWESLDGEASQLTSASPDTIEQNTQLSTPTLLAPSLGSSKITYVRTSESTNPSEVEAQPLCDGNQELTDIVQQPRSHR